MAMNVDRMMERGMLRSGSFTSLPTYVTSIHPSSAHSTATSATPNDAICLPSGASDQSGARFATLPPGSTNPTTISTVTSPSLVRVSTFCVIAPSLTPSELSTVSPTIEATATALIPPSSSGTKKPTYVANPRAIAAIEAGLITTPLDQPYRYPHSGP